MLLLTGCSAPDGISLQVDVVELRNGDGPIEFLAYEEFEERVLAGRIPENAEVRFAPVTGDRFVRAHELDLVESLRNADRVAWRHRFMHSGPPLLTVFLVGIQIRIWLAAQVPGLGEWMAASGMNWLPPALEDGETWRIFTSGLLHTDFLHILLNMVWMAYTGWNLERALGRVNVATIFFFAVFVGGVLSMFLTPGNPSLGASGGVYGLVSASVVFGFIRQDILPERGRNLFGAALAPYLILMFFSGLSDARTDNWAHFGGIVAGSVLAFVLDPPGFERGHRNRIVQIGGTLVMVGTLVFLHLAGPRVHPLVDSEQARFDALPRNARAKRALPDLYTAFDYRVPAGWKPGIDAAGLSAFRSPVMDGERSVAVSVFTADHTLELDELVRRWKKPLLASQDALSFDEEPIEWQGRPGIRVSTVLGSGASMEFVGAVRGMVGIQRVRAVLPGALARLQPLFDRVDASIEWHEPIALQAARREAHATPHGVRARTTLAVELARWGEVNPALLLMREVVAERPEDPERWQGLLHIAALLGDDAQFLEIANQALAQEPSSPALIVSVADALRDRGDEAEADGLLQLAWMQAPGDRFLKRALRRAKLPFMLTPEGVPFSLIYAGPTLRDPDQAKALSSRALSVDAARAWAAEAAAERALLAQAFDPRAPDVVQQLLTLRDGGTTPYHKDQRALRRALVALEGGRPPRWMPRALQTKLLEPGVIEAVRGLIPPPDQR